MKALSIAVGLIGMALAPLTLATTPSQVVAAQLRDTAMAGQTVAWPFVSELTARYPGRVAGSSAEHAAAAWSATQLRQLGFDLVDVQQFPLTSWQRGEESVAIVGASERPLVAIGLGGTPATPTAGVEGEVVLFDSLEALRAAAPASLTGKIAMVSRRMPRTQAGIGYGVVAQARAYGPAEAAARGAIGFVMRSVATGKERFAHTGSTHYHDGKVPLPSFALAGPDADRIEALLALKEPVRLRIRSSGTHVPSHSQNVVAELRGRTRPDEVIVLAAHLDSWDNGSGAVDDGAGAAIVVAAAKLIADLPQRPQRTIRVVLYGSEEVNQPHTPETGGRAYHDRYAGSLAQHVLALESDFGAGGIYGLSVPSGVLESAFGIDVLRVLAPLQIVPSRDAPGRGGVDIAPLAKSGVPVFVLRQDGTDYFNYHHTANDTLDKIERSALEQNVAAWAALIWLAADSEVDFRDIVERAESGS